MDLSPEAQELFRRYGRLGGRERAARMSAADRRTVARLAAMARWIRARFGDTSFERLGLPGGDIVDAGLADLAAERATPESLAVSLAAPRLRREGVPVSAPLPDPERRLFELLSRTEGDLAHARYNAYLRRMASFADACRAARIDRDV